MPIDALLPVTDRRDGIRGALLHTLPGRAVVTGLAIKLVVALLRARRPAADVPPRRRHRGVGWRWSPARLLPRSAASCSRKRRLLWRVRRKLILSYIFIGFVPALLIVAFFLLGGCLLFSNFSSYLVQSRLRALERPGAVRWRRAPRSRFSARGGTRRRDDRSRGGRRRVAASSRASRSRSCRCERAVRAPTSARRRRPRSAPAERRAAGRTSIRRASLPDWVAVLRGSPGLLPYAHRDGRPRAAAPDDDAGDLLVRARRVPGSPHRPAYAVVVDMPVDDAMRAAAAAATRASS